MFCKFSGGIYANHFGEIDIDRDPSSQPPSIFYPLWWKGKTGYLVDCAFPLKNFVGKKGKIKQLDAATYNFPATVTDNQKQVTYESILAAEKAG